MLNKLSRKDIDLLEQVSNSNASKEALNEYLEAHQKAYSAWNVYLGAIKANEACSEDTEELVVEIESIIEYEGEKYKLVERKAKAGDIVTTFQTRDGTILNGTQNNKPYKVTHTVTHGNYIYEDDNSREMLVYGWGDDIEVKTYENITEQATMSNNQFRTEIIQRAKDFVEELRNGGMVVEDKHGQYAMNVSFIVNARKKTVVALLRGVSTDKIRVKGIAKCHPDDVFNEHIGKAIALGRALDKDVIEFENAVQPTEAAKGMQIKMIDAYTGAVVIDYPTGALGANCEGHPKFSSGSYSSYYKIIDDTNAQYNK